jgi:hypothetical protein
MRRLHAAGRTIALRGEAVPGHKLTERDVHEIRQAAGTHRQIADRYGVSAFTIRGIRLRKSWAWLK